MKVNIINPNLSIMIDTTKEANLLKSLNHPNIVEYADYFKTNLNFFIVMELCEVKIFFYFLTIVKLLVLTNAINNEFAHILKNYNNSYSCSNLIFILFLKNFS